MIKIEGHVMLHIETKSKILKIIYLQFTSRIKWCKSGMLLAKPACSTTKERESGVMDRHSYRRIDGQALSYRWRI